MSEVRMVASDTIQRVEPTLIHLYRPADAAERIAGWLCEFPLADACPSHDPRWLLALRDGLGHAPYCLTATRDGQIVGILPLACVDSFLFGRFLVALPYLNSAGLRVTDESAAKPLLDQAVQLADQLDVRYLELRHEVEREHPALTEKLTNKVHMRLELPNSVGSLWNGLKSKVRNQVRKARTHELDICWGREELLDDFYDVFSTNMRDLGSPVFGRKLFAGILQHFPDESEFCVVRAGDRPLAAACLIHGATTTEVPSASSLRKFNSMNSNMLMYWALLERAVERGEQVFDFGRSSTDSNTFKFKKQWGAEPAPAVWQYYVRRGQVRDMRPESGRFDRMIALWKRLPVPITRIIGPQIVRGIP